jgi:hypothetical protein
LTETAALLLQGSLDGREGSVDYEWQESDRGPPRKYYTDYLKETLDGAGKA